MKIEEILILSTALPFDDKLPDFYVIPNTRQD